MYEARVEGEGATRWECWDYYENEFLFNNLGTGEICKW